mmetsp:Transcript_56131/g.119512  ORF Transcript_56131/g.119512 Transcript_56131/m.119512 type:complete len:92 (-) Transcript_56131:217-492(-)
MPVTWMAKAEQCQTLAATCPDGAMALTMAAALDLAQPFFPLCRQKPQLLPPRFAVDEVEDAGLEEVRSTKISFGQPMIGIVENSEIARRRG